MSALGQGGTGTITSVEIISGGSGYFKPPHIVISEGGRGCEGEMFEAILGDSLYHPIIAYPGVGLDLEILAVDQPFDTITVRYASDPLKLVFPSQHTTLLFQSCATFHFKSTPKVVPLWFYIYFCFDRRGSTLHCSATFNSDTQGLGFRV